MRKSAFAGIIASSLLLGGCAGTLPDIKPEVQATVQQVISGVQQACGFSPLIESITAMVGAASVGEIVTQVCNAVTTKSLRRASRDGTVATSVRLRGKSFAVRGRFAR